MVFINLLQKYSRARNNSLSLGPLNNAKQGRYGDLGECWRWNLKDSVPEAMMGFILLLLMISLSVSKIPFGQAGNDSKFLLKVRKEAQLFP